MKETHRLDQLIAAAAPCSRREASRLIRDSHVSVNGAVCRVVDRKVGDDDIVLLDGRRLTYCRHVYYMLYKPAGVLSATEDRHERTVLDLVPASMQRDGLFPAGRLDKDTTGLLILTDDGDYAHRMLSPRRHVEKRYIATVDRMPAQDAEERFSAGLTLSDGTCYQPASLRRIGADTVEVVLHEGRYHQVKRMLSCVGSRVIALHRESIGQLTLDHSLSPGELRVLSDDEAQRALR